MSKKPPELNPFVQTLAITGVWKLHHLPFKVSEGSKNTFAHSTLIDADNRVSIYTDNLLQWFFQLSPSAKDMFMWISHKIGYETDVIEMNEEKYCEETGVSRGTFHSAKSALTNRLIIPRTTRRNTYWVNPSYLYKGDRIKQFNRNVVQVNENPLKRSITADIGPAATALMQELPDSEGNDL